jgi:N-acetylglucosaminyldiphosphoundecaprenol N-acetyl-beta-D-mannosaminyltransferase
MDHVKANAVLVGDVAFAPLTERETAAEIIGRWQDGEGGWVSTPNTHQLELISRSPTTRQLVETASLVVADGMPVVWASRLQGTPLPERVAGSNLVWTLAGEAADAGASIFLLGGEDTTASRAQEALEDRIPKLRVAGTYSPPLGFEQQPEELARIREQLVAAQPDLVYVGLGFPKQEQLIQIVAECLPRAWFLGIGISLSFISGDISRAPSWMQRCGLEWGYRLWCEPRRLFGRYVVHGVPFTLALLLRSASSRARHGRRHALA